MREINEAKKKLNKAVKFLSESNFGAKLEKMPTPEDWLEGNKIIYAMRVARKVQNFSIVASKGGVKNIKLDILKFKREVKRVINQNKKWTRKFEELLTLLKKLENNPEDKNLVKRILQESHSLDIFIKDKIKKRM